MGKVLELVTDKLQQLCKVKPETVGQWARLIPMWRRISSGH